ncbi:MAG: GNAT family N-acetyltransferase [Thermoplasmata archaeon]|nr:GNAT family N-acetyltransferase [Thermoplasmata archaeon]
MEIRSLKDREIGKYTELFNKAEFNDPEFRLLTEEKMRKRIFSKSCYTLDGYFAAFDNGRMVGVGYGRFNPDLFEKKGRLAFFDISILPDYFDTDAGKDIFSRIVDYFKSHNIEKISAREYLSNSSKVRLLESLGFEKTPYQRYAMKRDPRGVETPELPDGYIMRNPRLPDEMEEIVNIANEAYATRGGFSLFTLEEMSQQMYFTDPASHSGIFVIERLADNKMVGAFCSHIDRDFNELKKKKRGASYLLVVIPEERKKGFGKALTAASLIWIAEQGMTEAFLGVNHQNPDAVKVYTDMGYERFDGIQGFELIIKHVLVPIPQSSDLRIRDAHQNGLCIILLGRACLIRAHIHSAGFNQQISGGDTPPAVIIQ